MALTENELQAQWSASVDLLEQTRVYADDTVVGSGNLIDTIISQLEGEYTPAGLATATQSFRATLASLVTPSRILEFISPCLFDYGTLITDGSGYADLTRLMRALYEHFVNNSLTVASRTITYDASATAGGSNVGNAVIRRLTEDENGFDLEFCHVENKRWRCRSDQNSGTKEHAEMWEVLGDAASFDALQQSSLGSGTLANRVVRAKHAGTSQGGSKLRNSSFSTYDLSADDDFNGWALDSGTAPTQATGAANVYRGSPGSTTDYSMKMSTDAKVVQTLANMNPSRLDPDVPYFCRIMVNIDEGSGVGGSVVLRCGSKTATLALASFAAGWNEIRIGDSSLAGAEDPSDCWFRNFNEDDFDIEIEWSSASSGYILIDDAIFREWDYVDGTYWAVVGGTISSLVDDTLDFEDTGGAPATGKIQWYLFRAGLGYLPSTTGTETFTDP